MSRSVEGRAFHASGQEWENARSTMDVRHLGRWYSYNVLSAERRPSHVGLSATAKSVSTRYTGHIPWWTECIMVHSLCWMRWCTSNKCSWRRAVVTWSHARSPSMRRATAFCTHCRGAVVDLDRPGKTELSQSSLDRTNAWTNWAVSSVCCVFIVLSQKHCNN